MGKSYKDLRKYRGVNSNPSKSVYSESSSTWSGKNRPFEDDGGEGFPRKGIRGGNWEDYDQDDYSYGERKAT